jgi:serine-type D-Ala-D-Ala carboxypeptidase/endopeptidase
MMRLFMLVVFCGLGFGQTAYDFSELDRILATGAAQVTGGMSLRLTQNGRVIYEKSFGGYELNRVVAVASASKWLSGAGVMAAVDAGKVKLEDPIARFVPSFTGDKAGINLRQAFSHTSGFPGESVGGTSNPETQCLNDRTTTLERCVDEIARVPLVAAPGAQFAYGSLSMQAAGRMVEVATATGWSKWMNDKILTPLGMTRSLVGLANRDGNPLVAGSYLSTGPDYSRFVQMILNGGVWEGKRILSAESVERMRTDQTAGARIASTPYAAQGGLGQSRYGVGGWLVPNPPTPSLEMSSQGAFGFSPWVDYSRNLTGVLAVQDQLADVMKTYMDVRAAVGRIVPVAGLSYSGVTNGASFQTGALSPGEIVVLFGEGLGGGQLSSVGLSGGRLPAEWQGTRVLIDGQAAPLIYTSARQVAAVVPFSVAGKAGVTVEVSYQGRGTGAFVMPVEAANPALFGAVLNEDGTLNSQGNPAARGSVVVGYGTGFGRYSREAADGSIVGDARGFVEGVGVMVGGLAAEVIYAGSAPGLVAGAAQVNLRLPVGVGVGRNLVQVRSGEYVGKGAVEVWVR